jgi:hypothetical protein
MDLTIHTAICVCFIQFAMNLLYGEYVLIIYSAQMEVPTYESVLVTFNISDQSSWLQIQRFRF